MKAYDVSSTAQASFFLRSSGQSVKEIVKLLKKFRTMSEQLFERKDFRRQTKEWMAGFFTYYLQKTLWNYSTSV